MATVLGWRDLPPLHPQSSPFPSLSLECLPDRYLAREDTTALNQDREPIDHRSIDPDRSHLANGSV